ncbi:putative Zn-binding protein involved in type VI secretion [Nitrobacteraceae bacterium AZCC 1564]
MTAKSKRKDNKSASKTMVKGALDASAETISQGSLEAPAHVVSEDVRSATADVVSEGTPSASAGVILSSCANAGEVDEKVLTGSTHFNAQGINAQGSMILQNLVQEWFEFAGMRMRQHMHLIETIQGCRSLPDLQQAYSQFWQNAYTQYGEKAQRMLLITQGAMDDASCAAHENGALEATLH